MNLRDYQQGCIDGLRNAFNAKHRRVLLVAPTGAGKTVMFSYLTQQLITRGNRVLLLAHRDFLLEQISDTLKRFDIQHGFIAAKRRRELCHLVQVAGVHTLKNRIDSLAWKPDWIICDECFPAGTLVDCVPIEKIKLGDKVKTHLGYGKVTHLFKTRPSSMVSIKLDNGNKLTCTGNHPIFTQDGFKSAKDLKCSDVVVSMIKHEQLHHLSENNYSEKLQKLEAGKTLWFKGMPIEIFEPNNSEEFCEIRGRDNEISENKWNAFTGDESACINEIESNGVEANDQNGKWNWSYGASISACISTWLGNGISNQDEWCSIKKALSHLLQGRYWESPVKSGNRSRRQLAQRLKTQGARCEERRVFAFHRVEAVEVHEQTSCGTFGGLCPDGFVYNLEVENGNTYFAEGILVHNCHHATAGSWKTILEAYPASRVVGVTATPQRLDGRGLGDVFDEMVMGPKVQDLMDQGFLSRVHYYSPKTVSTEGMHTRMGDYVQREIEEAVNARGVTGHAVKWYRKVCDGAPAITFCASIAHSEQVAEGFREAGYRWQALHSHASYADNQAAIRKLANGELQGVSSCDIISEGFDVPVVTAAILLRPTKSLGLHLQQIGRVLRPAPGKEKAIVIDHVGNVAHCKAGTWMLNHGRAEDDREWSLDGKTKGTKPAPMKRCPECLGIMAASARVCPLCATAIEAKERGELAQLEGDLETLPQWLPPPETGLRKRILEAISNAVDPYELIPAVPENCYAREFTEAMRLKVARFLEDYTVTRTEQHWNRFKELLADYLKRITGALCATATTLEDFKAIGELNGYKPGWAFYRHQQKTSHVRS